MDDNSRLVALQLGNTYGLVFLVASAVLYTTSEIKVVRNYLLACWLADISHVYVCYHVMGWNQFVNVAGWNSMTWGNVGVTVCTDLALILDMYGFTNYLNVDNALLDKDGISSRLLWSRFTRPQFKEGSVMSGCYDASDGHSGPAGTMFRHYLGYRLLDSMHSHTSGTFQ